MCSTKWITSFLAAVVVLAALATSVFAHELSTPDKPGRGGDFTLQSFDGPVSLQALHGDVVLLFFGYTACPDVCPVTLAVLSQVFSQLTTRQLDRVTALFVSLDPERDTPAVLKKYTHYFHPNIIGVTDSTEVIDEMTENYGVAYEKRQKSASPIGYVIYHTLDMLVIDSHGQLLDTRIPPATSVEEITVLLKSLLGGES